MLSWQVGKFSELTGVSVRMLRHYDKIGLLQPSVRQSNGYRVYLQNDLLKLQQVEALKFLGFELSKIKDLLRNDLAVIDHFKIQAKVMEQKAELLQKSSTALRQISVEYSSAESIPWQKIITLIEVCRMKDETNIFLKDFENSAAEKVLSPEQVKAQKEYLSKVSNEEIQKNIALFSKIESTVRQVRLDESGKSFQMFLTILGDCIGGNFEQNYGEDRWNNLRDSYKRIVDLYGEAGPGILENAKHDSIINYFTGVAFEFEQQVRDNLSEDPVLEVGKKRVGYWLSLLDDMFGDNLEERESFEVKMRDVFSKDVFEWIDKAKP